MVGQDMGAKQPSDREWRDLALGDLVDIKHGFAFKGDYIHDEPHGRHTAYPGKFCYWAEDSRAESIKYYSGDVPGEFVLCEGDLLVTMTDLSKQCGHAWLPRTCARKCG